MMRKREVGLLKMVEETKKGMDLWWSETLPQTWCA